jgi:ankyrin repeat protein
VSYLVEHAPGSALVARTSDGAYPLHVALEHGASLDVIELPLHRHDPVNILLRNHADETPLHVACRCGALFDIIQSLVDHYPASVKSVTSQGDLPLFLACETAKTSLDATFILMKNYPELLYR